MSLKLSKWDEKDDERNGWKMTTRFTSIDEKFTKIFNDLKQVLMDKMRSLRKDMERTKPSVKIISDKVDSVEKVFSFSPRS